MPLEVCVDSPAGLTACVEGSADRIELCSALGLGGLTPSPGLMAMAANIPIPVHAMIRPVAGGFILTDQIRDAMTADIAAARQAGLAGVVLGAMTGDLRLDVTDLARLVAAAGPMSVTLHRAIDLCQAPMDAIDQAVELGITRVLTSGGAPSADKGAAAIGALVRHADGRLIVMAGAGLHAENVARVVRETGVREVHSSCATAVAEDEMIAAFGFAPKARQVTDPSKIKAMRAALSDI